MLAGLVHVSPSTKESAKSQTLQPVTYSTFLFANTGQVLFEQHRSGTDCTKKLYTHYIFHSLILMQKELVKGNRCAFFCNVSSVKGQLCMSVTFFRCLLQNLSPYAHHLFMHHYLHWAYFFSSSLVHD